MKKILRKIFIPLLVIFTMFGAVAQNDTLKFEGAKQFSDYVTGVYKLKYPSLTFLKHRLVTPQYNVYDYYKGLESDSICNALKYLLLVNDLDVSNYSNDAKINLLYLERLMLQEIAKNITPISIAFVEYSEFKDSALLLNAVDFLNNKFVDKSPPWFYPFKKSILFASSPLNQVIYGNKVNFLFNDSLFLSNLEGSIANSIEIDFDDGKGYVRLVNGKVVTIEYVKNGIKKIKAKLSYKGKTYYSSSQIEIAAIPSSSLKLSQNIVPPDQVLPIIAIGVNNLPIFGEYGIWYGYCNNEKRIRKPYIISTGFNPGNGKQLVSNGLPQMLNFVLNNVLISVPNTPFGWNGDWRGTFYETENGVYNKLFSPNNTEGDDNGNRYLDRLRDEGYDVIICAYNNGVDFAQNNANIFKALINKINQEKLANNSYFENVVSGYSAGGISSRLALAQMESDYRNGVGPHPHTKMWVGFETESQGANVPLGLQHFIDFQQNPSNLFFSLNPLQSLADIINQVVAGLAYSYNNNPTAYELANFSSTYPGIVTPQRVSLLNKFASIPGNLSNGYPEYCRRVGVAQGSAVGVQVPHTQSAILNTQLGIGSGNTTAVSVPSSCGGTYTVYRPHAAKTTKASWWSSANSSSDIFQGKVLYDLSFTFFPKLCVYLPWPLSQCVCSGPYSIMLPVLLTQKTVSKPNQPYYVNYDDAPASTQATQKLMYEKSAYPFYNNFFAGTNSFANLDPSLHGFATTVSTLDLHDPSTNQAAPIFTSPATLGLMYRAPATPEPNKSYGYPHLNSPLNPYKITPYDAVFAIGSNPGYYTNGAQKPANQLHVEDPSVAIGDYLSRVEVAPEDLFLSNRRLAATKNDYKAEFEARSKIIVGNGIYSQFGNINHLTPDGNFHVDQISHAILHAGDAIVFLPGTIVDLGARLDAYILKFPCENRLR
ncbi:MAG: hypothetical protein IT260_24085 [Saprospiraceae bacterium]|nr:hypothetical protein [Saprospiraceae bacterium]